MEKIEKIPAWIERLLLPKLNEISGGIKSLEAKIESVDNKVDVRIDRLRKEMLAKFESVDVKFDSLRNKMISKFDAADSRVDSLEARLPVMEKMAEFEVRLADCEAF